MTYTTITDGAVRGISATDTKAENLRGSATFASAATKTVTFTTNEPDATYFIGLSANASEKIWWTGKVTTGFTIHSDNATSVATVDWILVR